MPGPLSTHVLDTARGRPAAGLAVQLERRRGEDFVPVAAGRTDADGRVSDLVAADRFEAGVWRLCFDTGSWFEAEGIEGFYPVVRVVFRVRDPAAHHHVPLLLSPYGYSTYRGS